MEDNVCSICEKEDESLDEGYCENCAASYEPDAMGKTWTERRLTAIVESLDLD